MESKTRIGLSSKAAEARLDKDGYNELLSQKKQNAFSILLKIIEEPMLLLLVVAGVIYFLLGEPRDSVVLSTFIVLVIGVTFYQEKKTERALEALRNISSPHAIVWRDGEQRQIPSRELVVGDIVVIREGDRVPADSAVLSAVNLFIDESLLTGESIPVRKSIWDGRQKSGVPGGDGSPFVYSGSLVVQGRATVEVSATGSNTEIGKIGKSLSEIDKSETLLQKETGLIVRNFAILGGLLCLLVVIALGMKQGAWLKGVLAGITLGMSMLPEEFSVVMIIFLAMGAWRMSKRNVITRKAAVIETLGAATVLCVDKTGTITMNQMRLGALMSDGETMFLDGQGSNDLPEKYNEILECSSLACQPDPFDPMEKAIMEVAIRFLSAEEKHFFGWSLVHEYPLSSDLLALSHVWQSPERQGCVVATKGAPEAIIDLCHLDASASRSIMEQARKMAALGHRVLGVAKASFDNNILPSGQHDFDFRFIGLLGFIDPILPSVAESVQECYRAGIRVVMITGDYQETAGHIAREIGLKSGKTSITGQELALMSPEELAQKIKEVDVFARVVPEQKLLLVNALRANGEIVAMTGDGVNDAPALKAAHIGIAMGKNGTDVAREASDMIVLNNDFSSIVRAIRLGRTIYDNLRKAMAFIFAVHVPIAGITIIPILFDWPIVLFPVHVAFLELIIDPACTIVFESIGEESDVMRRPPRKLKESLFSKKFVIASLLQGFSMLTAAFVAYLFSFHYGFSDGGIRSLTFATIVFGNIILILVNLSRYDGLLGVIRNANRQTMSIIIFALSVLTLTLAISGLRKIFSFDPVRPLWIFLSFVFVLMAISWLEVHKSAARRKKRTSQYSIG